MSSVTQLSNHADKGARGRSQRTLLANAQADLANLRAAVVAITAKLDADGGVVDTNYAATTNPAALNTTA
ncbi:hypothetical protein BH20PSE1_BH20PSE1_01130 [soil metagenome]